MTPSETIWIIEPRDPLIARDGRPFGRTPGAQARSLPFPFPSTTAGGFRTHVWQQMGQPTDQEHIATIKKTAVRGPLLVELLPDNATRWMAPAPADALFFTPDTAGTDAEEQGIRKRLVPINTPDGAQTDLAGRIKHLVGLPTPDRRKPHKKAPRFWHWEQFEQWLTAPTESESPLPLSNIGHNGPQQESRTHVAIDAEKQTSKDEHLFQTHGLEFTHHHTRLALAIAVEDPTEPQDGPLSPLGGERRIVAWRKSTAGLPPIPPGLLEQVQHKHKQTCAYCRVILLTPAHFEKGWEPTWLLQTREGVEPTLQAVAIQRPQVVSGWDLAAGNGNDENGKKKPSGKPKPTRRLAPAGSVFFLKLDGEPDAIAQWVRSIWMHCISDDEQSRRDGFGLAAIGTWDGKPQSMKGVSEQ